MFFKYFTLYSSTLVNTAAQRIDPKRALLLLVEGQYESMFCELFWALSANICIDVDSALDIFIFLNHSLKII